MKLTDEELLQAELEKYDEELDRCKICGRRMILFGNDELLFYAKKYGMIYGKNMDRYLAPARFLQAYVDSQKLRKKVCIRCLENNFIEWKSALIKAREQRIRNGRQVRNTTKNK